MAATKGSSGDLKETCVGDTKGGAQKPLFTKQILGREPFLEAPNRGEKIPDQRASTILRRLKPPSAVGPHKTLSFEPRERVAPHLARGFLKTKVKVPKG